MPSQPFEEVIVFTDGYWTANTPTVPMKPNAITYPSLNCVPDASGSIRKFNGVRPVTMYPFPPTESADLGGGGGGGGELD